MSNAELEFERFWKLKPSRKGENSKKEARLKFIRLVANGHKPEKIISAAQQWAENVRAERKEGTEYVPMVTTWLNQQRFLDYPDRENKIAPEEIRSCGKLWRWLDGRYQLITEST